jgi:nucleoside-diphosphate-sugar epimerase
MDSYRPATLALTGGTGALGFAFLQRIFRQDPRLSARLLVRSSSSSFQSDSFQGWLRRNESRVTLVDADLRGLDAKQLAALLETDGGLWHFAALTALNVNSQQVARAINEVNLEGTRRLVEAALAQQLSRPFYHISTAYVAGDRTGATREDEGDVGQVSRNPYEASKLAAETIVHRAFAAGITGAIFRPSVVVDDGTATGGFKMVDACAYAVALAVKRGEPFVFRLPADARINLVHSEWVIAAMIDLARLPSGSGRTYHLTAPRSTYFRDIAGILEREVPNLKLSFEPGIKRSEMPSASKIFDKAVTDLRPYLESKIEVDRTNTERDLSAGVTEKPLDLTSFCLQRLQSELGQIAHRK